MNSKTKTKEAIELKEYTIKYRLILEKAINTIEKNIKNDSYLKEMGDDFFDMAKNYLADGKVLEKKNDLPRALASYSYAYAWIDAGVRIGLFYGTDRKMFTLYK
jgi:hypothetical protein